MRGEVVDVGELRRSLLSKVAPGSAAAKLLGSAPDCMPRREAASRIADWFTVLDG